MNYIPYAHPVSTSPAGFYKYPPPSPSAQLVPYLQEVHAADGGTIGGCEVQWGVSPAIGFIHLLVSHGRRQQAQQLYGVTHTAVNRETLYIHWSPMAAVNRLSNSMGSHTQLSTEKRCIFTGSSWLLSRGSARLWGHAHSCQQRKAVHLQVPHGCCQQAQQLAAHLKYRPPNTNTNRSEGV